VLVCECSSGYAAVLRRMLEQDGDISVVAVCASAEETIVALPRLRPHVVTMDLELPGMSGLAAIEEIMSDQPVPILVISADAGGASGKAAAALAAGALDAIAKKSLDLRDPGGAAAAAFRHRIRLLSRARVIRHPRAGLRNKLGNKPGAGPGNRRPEAQLGNGPEPVRGDRPEAVPGDRPAPSLGRGASAIGMCGSAGGPHALAQLLSDLPADYEIPILVVQHIAVGFTEGLAHWLDRSVGLPVRIAEDGVPAASGAWIAPEGVHLLLTPTGRLRLDGRTAVGHHRPSGDVLFESIAAAAGETGVAIVLSGMGSDGAVGAAAVRRAGGLVIAQDEESSAIYGMPRAAIAYGADLVLPPGEIAAYITGLRHLQITRTY
jgi:two-component system chemotaxis response regulator CheB